MQLHTTSLVSYPAFPYPELYRFQYEKSGGGGGGGAECNYYGDGQVSSRGTSFSGINM